MTNQLKQIGLRLKGLRDALELSVDDFAASCDMSPEEYIKYEEGERDFPISMLTKIANRFNVDVTTLMFDDEPRMNTYFITRKGKGAAINRVEHYSYEALAAGFNNRKADIFVVTVEPKSESTPIHQSIHSGHEFTLVLEGKMLLQINGKDVILEEGDSIYFDSHTKHGMKALDNKNVKFLAVIL